MSETRDRAGDSPDVATEQATRQRTKTWPTGLPALRLHRRRQSFVPPAELRGDADPPPPAGPSPRLLRAKRALAGLALLGMAWLGLFVVALLGMAAWHVLPIHRLSLDLLAAILEVVGACWIGMAALGCLLLGAFCVTLALTQREW